MSRIIDNYYVPPLKTQLHVEGIVSVHYFEYSKSYIFEGEKHDFWELLYVDKGYLTVEYNV